MSSTFKFGEQTVRTLEVEGETIAEADCVQTRFHGLHALAVVIKAGSFTLCDFRNCVFDNSAMAVVFDSCSFRDCRLVGVSGARFINCRMTNVRLSRTMGCRIEGGVLRRCTLDADLAIHDCARHDCATIQNRRLLAARASDRVREPYEEFHVYPRYRSAGEVLTQRGTAGVRIGAQRAAVRELIATRDKLPRYPRELRLSMLRRLKHRKVFGLSDAARRVLGLLIGIDQHVTGLVWPTVPWLESKTALSSEQVHAALAELRERGWLSAWVDNIDINAVFIDYDYVQAHFPAVPHAG